MADHDTPERFENLLGLILGAFEYVREMLADLPIPVIIPEFDTDGGSRGEALLSLDRARALVKDEPIPAGRSGAMDSLILDWFTMYELIVVTRLAGPAPWRLDCVEYALMRYAATLALIESGHLDDES